MRTINMPILALLFFERDNQPSITFQREASRQRQAVRGAGGSDDIWMIEYRETDDGTLVRGAGDRDIPSHGRVWIDSVTGRILRTEQISEDTAVRAVIDVDLRVGTGAGPAGARGDARELPASPHRIAHRRPRDLQPVPPVHGDHQRETQG